MSLHDKLIYIRARCTRQDNSYKNIENKETIKYSIGNLILIKDNIFVLSCYHGIKNHTEINMILHNTSYVLTCAAALPEYDLVLLKPNHIINCTDVSYYTINDIYRLIEKSYCTIPSLKLNIFYNRVDIVNILQNISYDSVQIESPISMISPKIVYISFPCNMLNDQINIKGLSGSLLLNKHNSIIGMVTSVIDEKIMVLHSSMIYRFLKEYAETCTINGICNIPMDYKVVCVNNTNGLMVLNAHSIQYKKSISSFDSNINHYHCMEQSDIIMGINNKQILSNGNIKCDILGIDIPIDTYIGLNFYTGQPINIALLHQTKKKYEILKFSIDAKPLKSMVKISYDINPEIMLLNGLVLSTLTENILTDFQSSLANITGDCVDIYDNNNYTNDGSQVIVLIDVDKEHMNDKQINEINTIGLPVVRNNDKSFSIPVLKKVNNNKINNFTNLKLLLNDLDTNSIKLQFKTVNTFNLSLKYAN